MQLKTDFRDYYDYMFDRSGQVFERMAGDRTLSKRDQYKLMESAGYRCLAMFKPAEFFAASMSMFTNVVVFTDDRAHCGEGKLLTTLGKAQLDYPDCDCVQWINTAGSYDRATSHRLLKIGSRSWWLRYDSIGGWMSNHAEDTEIRIIDEILPPPTLREYPLLAIDFIVPIESPYPKDFNDVVRFGYAIDWNTAPGMRHTGMNAILGASEVYELIKETLRS